MLKKTCLLAATLLAVTQLMAQQNATMITKTVNGAVERTDISEIDRITFTDATFNLNVDGYRILEADELTWPEDRLLPFFMAPASTLRSLDMSAAKLSGELLLIHGMADDNVHFRNFAEYTEALVQAGKQFDQQVYTNRNHSIFGGKTRHHLFTRVTKHFEEQLKE